MSPKIAVLGTGANGSCIAASLIEAGRDVVLIDQWPAHVEAMNLPQVGLPSQAERQSSSCQRPSRSSGRRRQSSRRE